MKDPQLILEKHFFENALKRLDELLTNREYAKAELLKEELRIRRNELIVQEWKAPEKTPYAMDYRQIKKVA